jgi:GcrA cell cycle regulator
MEWTATAIDLLRALWAEGHSTAEIGRRMGVTKNAIVGKAHRLDLPARPSPIRKLEAVTASASATPRRKTVREGTPTPRRATIEAPPPPSPAVPAQPSPAVVAPAAVRHFPRASMRSCCWPIGEPGTRDFRFCGAEADSGRPYCAEHSAIAYVRARDRRSDAA